MTVERRQYTPDQIAWVNEAETADERSRREDQLKASYTAMEKAGITHEEKLVLNELAYVGEEYALYFRGIQNSAGLDRKEVRKACRSLAAKGFASYRRGLCSEDDGMLAGSGYSVTAEGAKLARTFG